jgi:hypothetical protein
VGAVGALLGDLCTEDNDCLALPGAQCARGGCECRPGYMPTVHRKACIGKLELVIYTYKCEHLSVCSIYT